MKQSTVRSLSCALVCFGLAILALPARAQQAPELFEVVEEGGTQALSSTSAGPWVLRRQRVRLNAQALDANGTSPAEDVILNLFPDARYRFRRVGPAQVLAGGNFLWRAKGGDGDSGYALLVIGEHGVRGSISDGSGRYFKVVQAGGQMQEIREVAAGVAGMGDDYVVPPLLPEEQPQTARLEAGPVAQSTADTMDVLVVYSAGARQSVGGAANMQALADVVMAEMNQAFAASAISGRVRLAGIEEVQFPGGEAATGSFLSDVRTNSAIRALRDQYGADLVTAWIDGSGGGAAGIGYVMTQASQNFASWAYSVVEVDWVDGPLYGFAHEAGHNLGSSHDRYTGCDGGVFGYSCGYQQRPQTPRFHTIMAYQNGCSQCPKINGFSNPNVTHQGIPTGIASGPESADNGRTFNQTVLVASQFRDAVIAEISCDLSGDSSVNVIDVQLSINQVLGLDACGTADVSLDGACNVVDVQRLINAALGLGCQVGS